MLPSALCKKLPAALCRFVLAPSGATLGVRSSQFFGDDTGEPNGLPATPFVTYNAPNRGGVEGDPMLSFEWDGV